MTRGLRDLIIISIVAIATLLLALVSNVREELDGLLQKLGASGTDELIIVLVVLSFAFGIFSLRRWRELRADITERKRAEEALRESEVRLKEAQALGRIGNWEFDLDRQTIHWSDQVFALYERDRALGQPTVEEEAAYYSPQQAERLRKYARCAVEQGRASEYDLEAWLPSGKSAHFVATTRPVKDATGRVVRLFGTVQDITERKRVEDALRESEEKYRSIVENAHDGIGIVQDGIVRYANPALGEMWGGTAEGITGIPFTDHVQPEELPKVVERYRRRMAGEDVERAYETILSSKDGNKVYVELKGDLITFHGKPADLVVIRDITERKRVEEALRESEGKYRTLFESAPEAITIVSLDGTILDCNSEASRISRLHKEDLVGKHFRELGFFKEEDLPKLVELLQQLVSGRDLEPFEMEVAVDDNETIWVEVFPALLKKNNQVYAMQVITSDITERKRAEEALREREEKYRNIFENVQDVYYEATLDGTILEVSPSIEIISKGQYHRDDLIGKSMYDFYSVVGERQALLALLQERGSVTDYEIKLKNRDGSHVLCSISAKVQFDAHGAPLKIIGSMRDITERKRAEEALQRERDFAEGMIDTAQTIVLVLDTQGCIVRFNPYMEEISGYASAEVQGKDWFTAFLQERDRERTRNLFLKALGDTQTRGNVNAIVTRDGREREIEWYDKTLKDEQGNVVGLLSIGQDITERKKIEEALRRNEEQYRLITENSLDLVCMLDQKGKIAYTSPSFREVLGHKPEELVGSDFFSLVHPDDRAAGIRTLPRALFSKNGRTVELRYKHQNGEWRIFESVWSWVFDENRSPQRAVVVSRNITERKHAEEALRYERNLLRTLIDNIPDRIYAKDTESRFILCNKAVVTRMGMSSPDDIIGKSDFDFLPHELAARFRADEQAMIQSGQPLINREEPMDSASGITRWNLATKVPLRDSQGNIIGIVGVGRDITERKRAEAALERERGLLRALIQNIPNEISVKDTRGRIILANRMAVSAFGVAREEEVVEKTDFDFVKPHLAEQHQAEERAILDSGIPLVNDEVTRFGSTTGEIEKCILRTKIPLEDSQGKRIGLLCINQDITERKRAEEALRSSEAQFSNALKIAQLGAWEYDVASDLFTFNDHFYAIFRTTAEQVGGYTMPSALYAQRFVHPDDAPLVGAEIRKALETTDPHFSRQLEHRIIYADGEVGYITVRFFIVKDDQGRTVKTFGVNQDITERKRAEEALRESEERYRSLFENATIGIYRTTPSGSIESVNPALIRMLGYTCFEELAQRNLEQSGYEPSYTRSEFRERIEQEGEIRGLESAWKCRDGSSIFVCESAKAVRDAEGKTLYYEGIVEDITERKRAEEAIRASEEKYRTLVTQSPDGIFTVDLQGNFRAVNKAICDGLKYTEDELLSMKIWDIVPEKYIDRHKKRLMDILGGDAPNEVAEYEVRAKDGSTRLIEVLSAPQFQGTEVIGLQAIARDISERRRAETALRTSEAQFSNALKIAQLGAWEYDVASDLFTFNDHFYAIFRTTAEQVGGYTMPSALYAQRFVHPDDAPLVGAEIRKALETTDPHFSRQLEHRIIYADGEVGYITVRFFIVKDDQGRTVKTFGVNQDITERKRAEEALRESEEKYRRLFEESKDVIYLTTPDGKWIDINPSGVELFGFSSKEELLPTAVTDLYFNPEDRRTFQRCVEEEGFVKDFELLLKRKDGEKLMVLLTADAVRDDAGRIVAYRGIIRDVTKQKQLEKQLIQVQKMESIGTLAGGIAHDFNNILQIIRGYASFLRFGAEKPERTAQSIAAIDQAVKRGADLVRQILTFARKTDVVFGPISANLMIKEFAKMLAETFPKTINFSLELAKDVPPIVADVTQLHQLLLNLCVNARDAMPDGGTVTISTEAIRGALVQKRFPRASEQHYVHIGVSDTGVGMDGTIMGQIFEPFFTTKEKGRGTGLGLAVVWGIMESHKGFVNVESEVGRGTTFHLYFPIPHDFIKSRERGSETQKEIPGGSETILVAEDEEVLLELIINILEGKGYRVLAAKDGIEAINLYRRHIDQISLIITDLGLPKLGGTEVLQRVREMNAGASVIIASGYLEPHMKSELFKAGARAFVQKPYDPREILKNIREVLDGKG